MTTETATNIGTENDILKAIKEIGFEVETVKLQVAYRMLMMDETGETVSSIARDYNVARSTAKRYADKFEDQAYDILSKLNEKGVTTPTEPKPEPTPEPEVEETVESATEDDTSEDVMDTVFDDSKEETSEETEPQSKPTNKKKDETKEPKVDINNYRCIAYSLPLGDVLVPPNEKRGRPLKKDIDTKEFKKDISGFSEADKKVIRSIYRRRIFKNDGVYRVRRPEPEAVVVYNQEVKINGGGFDEFYNAMLAKGFSEKEAIKNWKTSKICFEAEDAAC